MIKNEISDAVQTTHFKTALDITLEESVKRANSLQKKLKTAIENGEDVTGRELKFRTSEIARLNNMSSLQQKLEDYRAKTATLCETKKANECLKSNNSSILGDHLTAMGQYKPNSHWHAHHIVCSKHASHAVGRYALLSSNIKYGINDPVNGCWLPTHHKHAVNTRFPKAVGHSYLHTKKYADWVNNTIANAKTDDAIARMLRIVKLQLLSMTSEKAKEILTTKGQQDLRTTA